MELFKYIENQATENNALLDVVDAYITVYNVSFR